MLLEGKIFITKQDKASKDTFLLLPLIFQSNLSLKISYQKPRKVTQGGGGKCQKSVTYYLNGPYGFNIKNCCLLTPSSILNLLILTTFEVCNNFCVGGCVIHKKKIMKNDQKHTLCRCLSL
jgi:hypothetical protein